MRRPNVLLVVLDAVRADHLSCYGYDRETTPTIDGLAADGVRYEHAFSTSNWTGAAHASLFTGYLPSQSGVYGESQDLPADVPTVAELLSEVGYRTFATSAGAHIRGGRGYDRGFDRFHETFRIRPNRHYLREFLRNPALRRQTWQTLVRGHDNYTAFKFGSLRRWIAGGSEPFFAFVNCKTAHHRYNPPRPYKSLFGPGVDRPRWEFVERLRRRLCTEPQDVDGFDVERLAALSRQYPVTGGAFEPTAAEWDVVEAWYDGAIRYLDDRLSELVSFLRSTGRMDETLLVVTADHGDLFGEHGLEKHQYSLLDKLLHVPLVVSPPAGGRTRSRGVVSNVVSFADLFPTVLDAAGVTPPERPNAVPLTPFDDRRFHDHVYAEVGRKSPAPIRQDYPEFEDSAYNGPVQSVRDDEYKLVRGPEGTRRLCRWREDPEEQTDLATEYPDVVDRLTSELEAALEPMNDRVLDDTVDDDRLEQQLKDLGYR
jgi:arylsulfatase A-like enzyme